VIDVFVDGGVGSQGILTINGKTPLYYECIIEGRNVGWLGNYDGTKKGPMPENEFLKFLSTLRPILEGSGFALEATDDNASTPRECNSED
jgi:hypothetical protein